MLYYRGCVTRRQILINFCQAIHADEEDPELMAQDFECFPRQWYNEGFISEEDFARHIVEECYNLEKTMGDLARYFDYEAFGRELFMYDYTMGANGHVFRPV
ncbi:antirestriction protein ArdA [uncultured Muribaculum sp.]|uniref:antirestriction protein ArdA n=1 Tax=uncultured Muribaculum sp. TaxID=1918613 RepID=UPI0025A561C4|nr:antirestriction protein ArdA [uncultured Muribaculum sp.]